MARTQDSVVAALLGIRGRRQAKICSRESATNLREVPLVGPVLRQPARVRGGLRRPRPVGVPDGRLPRVRDRADKRRGQLPARPARAACARQRTHPLLAAPRRDRARSLSPQTDVILDLWVSSQATRRGTVTSGSSGGSIDVANVSSDRPSAAVVDSAIVAQGRGCGDGRDRLTRTRDQAICTQITLE